MSDARKIERAIYKCPEVNCSDYTSFPLVDEDIYMGMCSDFSLHFSEICMFIFVRESGCPNPFVDIYIWDITNLEGGYTRFVICDGFQMSEELERKYLEYISNEYIYISDELFHEANQRVIELFPQWHYKDYRIKYLDTALQHLYFASHSSGPREILFKAEGLENIAAHMGKLPCYNIMGTTPSAIIDKDIPLKLLRILDRETFLNQMCDPGFLEACKEAYSEYCDHIGKDLPSVGQWNYILELHNNKGLFGGYPFKRTIYEKASNFVNPNEIDAYKQYFSLWKELKIPGKLNVPDYERVWEALEQLEELVKHKTGKTRLNRLFAARKTMESYRYEYTNNTYEIIMPSSAFDLYWEALCQHNCLADYAYSHAEGDTTILFLRKKDAPNDSFVTMEVEYDEIRQVYGTCNKLPQKDVYEFIVKYAKAKVLGYDMRDLILDNIYKVDEEDSVHGNELVEFALHNQRSLKTDSVDYIVTPKECHQITMEETFPELFEQELIFDDEF